MISPRMKTPSAPQQPTEQDEQLVELLRAEVLRDRVQHHDVDRPGRQRRDLLRRAHLDLRIIAEAAAQGGAHHGSGLAQDQPAGSLGDDIRVQCLAAAVVEHGGAGRQVCADVLRNPAVMHVAMASIDVDRMFGIPEGDPVAHSLGPRLAPSGRAGLYGNRRRLPGLISSCSCHRPGRIAVNRFVERVSSAGRTNGRRHAHALSRQDVGLLHQGAARSGREGRGSSKAG